MLPSNNRAAVAVAVFVLLLVTPLYGQVARLADGQPDIQGMYTRSGVRGIEANAPVSPIDPADKNALSVSNRGDGLGPYPRIFGQGAQVLRGGQQGPQRQTGIIDPPDRKLP